MWFTLYYAFVTITFLWMTFAAILQLRWCKRLEPLKAPPPIETQFESAENSDVQCSIIVAARDEESRIEQSIRRLLDQCHVTVEVLVIDDRSTDRTEQILRRIALEDNRVVVQRVVDLPKGWLGKCHACHLGATKAKGDWILFTDADCWLAPDAIFRAIRTAESAGVDHLTMTPGIEGASLSAQAWHLALHISLANWIAGVNRDRAKAYLGMGAFNLVRSSSYRLCGGYQALRLTVLDDVRLGLLLRRSGFRTRAFIGGDDVVCHWGRTAFDMVKIMEKNYFAAMDFRLTVALVGGLAGLMFWSSAMVGPLTGTPVGMAAGLAWFSLCIPGYLLNQRLGWRGFGAFLVPLILPLLFYAILRSACVTTWQGGVWWRDTFYSLDELRKGSVR